MKTLLVISRQPGTAAAIRAVVDGMALHVLASSGSDQPLIEQADAVLIEEDLTGVKAIRAIEAVQKIRRDVPLLLLAAERQWQWEEDAYLHGVRHVLSKPIRPALLNELLGRVIHLDESSLPSPLPQAGAAPMAPHAPPAWQPAPAIVSDAAPLDAIRQFSRLLSGGFEAAPLVKSFVELLRELLRINRAAIFLVPPPDPVSGQRPRNSRQPLHCTASVGIAAATSSPAPLTLEAGIGGHLWKHGRALQSGGAESLADAAIARDFSRLGIQLALPVLDGGDMIGVALLDGHLTGEPLTGAEIALLFRLFESLGAAIRNCWEHERLTTNHRLLSDILADQAAGCLFVSRNLQLLQWNRRAIELLGLKIGEGFVFRDLPQDISSRIFEALTTGTAPQPFRHTTSGASPRQLQITVSAFQRGGGKEVDAVLVVIDDHTQLDRARELEVESSRLRLIQAMAEGMAHEIGNCLVPLSTHQQLMEHKLDDAEFRASLSSAMTDGVRRISRLSNQMLFLTRDQPGRSERLAVTPLVEEAFRDVQATVGDRKALLVCEGGGGEQVEGNAAALKHALSEIILNALQASPADSQVQVNLERVTEGGAEFIRIQISDKGKGFSDEAERRATEAFFTTRNVGLGLGLTVAKRIAETHGGRLEIAGDSKSGRVALLLPLVFQPVKPEPVAKQTRLQAAAAGKTARRVAEIDN